MRKSNIGLLLLEIWPLKASKRPKNYCFTETVNLSSFILNSEASDEKLFSNVARDQKSLATPAE